jgi:G patch domain-containing protein 1
MSHKRSYATYAHDNPPSHAPFAIYGTPLPAYDPESRDDGSYVPIWKQEVTDERGRKRLHGAFTGGFSAGYFNTVGSKEGWTPQSFVSSRSNRAKKDGGQGQKVEDFMDEEDLAEREESRSLETQGEFAGLGGNEGRAGGEGMFGDLFRAEGETMGMKLLQRMGWKVGQGIGPKVKRKARGDATGEAHLFAPEDSKMIRFLRKIDRKGIGFAGEDKLGMGDAEMVDDADDDDRDARILEASKSKVSIKSKQKVKKTGFGVGVLNDTGSDDDDAYDMGPKISYSRIIGGDRKKKKGLLSSNASPAVAKPAFKPSKNLAQRTSSLNGFRKCHDGRLPLDGFVLTPAPLVLLQENKYPPPSIPPGWKSSKLSSTDSTTAQTYTSTADAARASTLDPKARAALLQEPQLPGKSVFSYLTPAARERLASATGNTNLPAALSEKAPANYIPSGADQRRNLWDLVPELDKDTALAALQRGKSGWMPYAEYPEKRTRYRAFLSLKAGFASELPIRPADMGKDEWVTELREFAQAAEVFKPISGLMATRFASSTSAGTSGPKLASDAPDAEGSSRGKEEDPAEKAARMNMFGPLTRTKQPFYPTRLLCKRFNVRPPKQMAPDAEEEGTGNAGSTKADVVSQASLDMMMREASRSRAGGNGFANGGVEGGEESASAPDVGRAKVEEVDMEKNEAIEGKRAGDEVFKAIFGSDSEDD